MLPGMKQRWSARDSPATAKPWFGPTAVRFGDHGFRRHIDPFAVDPHAIVSAFDSQSTSASAEPSASEQHGPLPLLRLSNHCFNGASWP